MDSRCEQLLSARKGAQPCVPRQVCGRPAQTACRPQTQLSRETNGASIAEGLRRDAPKPVSYRLGGLFQAPVWQRRARASLSRLLYPSHRDFQSPPGLPRRRSRYFPVARFRPQEQEADHVADLKNSCGGSCCMCCPEDLCASATSASSATGTALNSSLCALSYWQQRQVSRDPPAVLQRPMWQCPKCGGPMVLLERLTPAQLRPRSLPRPLRGNHEAIFLTSNRAPQRRTPAREDPIARIPECSVLCFVFSAPPTAPVCLLCRPSIRLGGIQNA